MKEYLAAVSGGPDSMALLDIYKDKIYAVCHVNYNKRETAVRDKNIVKQYCKKYNIKFYCLDVSQEMYESYKQHNFQTVARIIRYEFFLKVAHKTKKKKILIAHNLDDFAETAYMQQIRSSNSLFYGIAKNNYYNDLLIERPLINKRKQALEDYCIKHKIPYGIDETNSMDIYERNKIRKLISSWSLLMFEKYIKQINAFNKKNASKLKTTNKWFNKWSESKYQNKVFIKIPNAIRNHVIYIFLSKNEIHGCSSKKLEAIAKFICSDNLNVDYRLAEKTLLHKNKNNISIIKLK